MKSDVIPLFPDSTYHIFNRSINSTRIFFEARNFDYFLKKLHFHTHKVLDLMAFCLMPDHFHLLIQTHTFDQLCTEFDAEPEDASAIISRQLAHCFNGYAQAINKAYQRTGGLFETPFRRARLDTVGELIDAVCQIHTNPERHNSTDSFRHYPWSSFRDYHPDYSGEYLQTTKVWQAFGDNDNFQKLHELAAAHPQPDDQAIVREFLPLTSVRF